MAYTHPVIVLVLFDSQITWTLELVVRNVDYFFFYLLESNPYIITASNEQSVSRVFKKFVLTVWFTSRSTDSAEVYNEGHGSSAADRPAPVFCNPHVRYHWPGVLQWKTAQHLHTRARNTRYRHTVHTVCMVRTALKAYYIQYCICKVILMHSIDMIWYIFTFWNSFTQTNDFNYSHCKSWYFLCPMYVHNTAAQGQPLFHTVS